MGGPEAVLQKAPPHSAPPAGREPVVVPPRPRSAESRPSGRPRPATAVPPRLSQWFGWEACKASAAGESHFQTAGSVHHWAGRRRMEVSLSAITFYLASTSSPVATTTMDREPVSRAEGGEAVAASGTAAGTAFRESERQVGEAAERGGGAAAENRERPASSTRQLPFWPVGLPLSRPPAGGVFRGFSSVPAPLFNDIDLEKGSPHQPLHWQCRRL